MKLIEKSQLTDKKYNEILSLIALLNINLDDIEEKFVRGSGSGGQKINKTSSAVQLKYLPTGIVVKYQKHRERSMNRIMALRELLEKLNPESKKDAEIKKLQKKKKDKARKSQKKNKV